MNEHNKVIAFSMLTFSAGFFALLAHYTQIEWAKYLFILISISLFLPAIFYFLEVIFMAIAERLGEMREAWYAPTLKLANAVQNMGPRQLDIMETGGVVKIRGKWNKKNKVIDWYIVTPEIDIPLTWVRNYLDLCGETFPVFPAQHGLSDNKERAYRRAFSKMVCNEEWGVAQWARGNKAPEWLLPSMAAVMDIFGWDMEE